MSNPNKSIYYLSMYDKEIESFKYSPKDSTKSKVSNHFEHCFDLRPRSLDHSSMELFSRRR